MKPISEKEVQKTPELARAIRKNRRRLTVRLAGGREHNVFLDTIMYIEHRDHAAEIHTTEGVFTTSQSARISALEQLLPRPPFLRCHRNYIVNLDHAERADKDSNTFIMKNGGLAYIRRGQFENCRAALLERRLKKAGGCES